MVRRLMLVTLAMLLGVILADIMMICCFSVREMCQRIVVLLPSPVAGCRLKNQGGGKLLLLD
jgi:hypothetical protein